MLEFVEGDIFDVSVDIRVNTVNCVGVMGAGVALAFKQRYPEMFRDYQRDCNSGEVRPGKMHIWKSLSGDWIINFPTKRHWREPSRYEDIETGLDDLRSYLDTFGPVSIGLPALGCGNGGLDWGRVSKMIREKLEGVEAHVVVFEPAASVRAGRQSSSSGVTDEERASAERLGYTLLNQTRSSPLETSLPLYFQGNESAISRKWIALIPSRSPGDREVQALKAIAGELNRVRADVTVALIHGSKVSDEIADFFIQHGIDTLLLLPFGVSTRPAIAKSARKERLINLASIAPANAKWSRQILGQTMELLRLNASALLISDPEPEWLTRKGLDRWQRTFISFVRYEETLSSTRDALRAAGAAAIGRRGDTGTPNLEHLLEPFCVGLPQTNPEVDLSPTEPDQDGEVLSVQLDDSKTLTPALLRALADMDIHDLAVTVRLPPGRSEEDRRRLIDLGFSPALPPAQ